MSERDVDVAVIGAGTAGLSALRAARKAGARGLLVDRGPLGTTCARVGCMPSKLLIAAADAAHAIVEAPRFGIRVAPGRVDGPAVLERLRRERDRFVSFVVDDCLALEQRGELLRGAAQILAPDLLAVDERTRVRFKSLVVATGSAPFVPPMFAGLPGMMTTDTVFELHTQSVLEDIRAGGDGVVARFRGDDGVVRTQSWSRVLVAAGRRGNLRLSLIHISEPTRPY